MRMLEVPHNGLPSTGYLSEVQSHLPFVPQRAYYIYGVPDGSARGGHAHRTQEQAFFCLHGLVTISHAVPPGVKDSVQLFGATPWVGLYMEPLVWHYMTFSGQAILLVFGSEKYDESEYIRHYEEWQRLVVR